jgi:hypothetical protein
LQVLEGDFFFVIWFLVFDNKVNVAVAAWQWHTMPHSVAVAVSHHRTQWQSQQVAVAAWQHGSGSMAVAAWQWQCHTIAHSGSGSGSLAVAVAAWQCPTSGSVRWQLPLSLNTPWKGDARKRVRHPGMTQQIANLGSQKIN